MSWKPRILTAKDIIARKWRQIDYVLYFDYDAGQNIFKTEVTMLYKELPDKKWSTNGKVITDEQIIFTISKDYYYERYYGKSHKAITQPKKEIEETDWSLYCG